MRPTIINRLVSPCLARLSRRAFGVCLSVALGACAGIQPGGDYSKQASVALAHPEETTLGAKYLQLAQEHDGISGFRVITLGVDGFLARAQMIDAAERTLDLQYYIFRGDTTGRLLTDALVRAADRGVRVRVLVDDGDTVAGDEQLLTLTAQPQIEIRVFNPFAYRGHNDFRRVVEFALHSPRLDYRMHNKLLVVDNSIAIIGGRNIGNQYFQVDPDSQFADDDVFAAGPIAAELSKTFDDYWNSPFAVPAQALGETERPGVSLASHRERAKWHPTQLTESSTAVGLDYVTRIGTGDPYAGIIAGRLPLVWAPAKVMVDSPDKKSVEHGTKPGRLMTRPVAAAAESVHTELLMVSPYFVPARAELSLLKELRSRDVRVRVLTNSLESSLDPLAFSAYMGHRAPLVASGVEMYEIRSQLGNARGSGQNAALARYGTYGLHAKLYVFDRQRLFIGSMNFDQRSKRLNTEVGLIIDSAELAGQIAARFDAMTQPENAYHLALRPTEGVNHLYWDTQENGGLVEYRREPSPTGWRRFQVRLLSLLPVSGEL